MALSSVKPCGRVMCASPHQTDQQHRKGVDRYELEDFDEQERSSSDEGARMKEEQPPSSNEIPSCENDDDTVSSLFSDKSSDQPSRQELPTFIAHQGFAPLQLQRKDECKSGKIASRWFKRSEQQFSNADQQQLFQPLFPKNCSTALPHATWSSSKASGHSNMLRIFGKDSKYVIGEQRHHSKQRPAKHEGNHSALGPTFELVHQRVASARDGLAVEKRRNSSASVDEVLRFREAMSKERHCDVRRPSTWEEEVRQAMARSLILRNQGGEALALERSLSMRDHPSSVLPSTLLVKANSAGIKSNATSLEAQSKRYEAPHQKRMNADERGMWCEMNGKSPSEERWEEAAEDEEQKELQRVARSQSMRYDALRAGEIRCVGRRPWEMRSSENALDKDHGWAVYKKAGYVNVNPHSEGTFAGPAACCGSMVGRSFSMRDTRMGLVMECASCGTALHDARGRLLCFCSCCAADGGGITTSTKKKGGIFRACRKLLGLGKKRASQGTTDLKLC